MPLLALLIVNAAVTWFLVGLIWVVQVVHYPLFARVGDDAWQDYHSAHARLITYVVAPVMFVEILTAVMLALTWRSPDGSSTQVLLWTGVALVFAVWISTAFVQVPLHQRLGSGLDAGLVRQLVLGNWVRTIAWSARGLLMAYLLYTTFRARPLADAG
jgi:hypothetical protein